MNKLQSLNTDKDIFVTLNPIYKPKDEKIIKVINYSHPIFDFNSVKTQKKVNKLQGKNKIFLLEHGTVILMKMESILLL